METNINILVTAIGGRAGYNLVRCLKESTLNERLSYVGADMNAKSPAIFCEEFALIPPSNKESYIEELQRIVEDYNVDLIIPTSDEESLILSKYKKRNINTVPIGDYEGILSVMDKLMLYESTKKFEIVPHTIELHKGSTIKEIKDRIGVPAFIKPRMGRGGRYTHIVKDTTLKENNKLEKYWKSYMDDFGPPICQPYIESNDYGIDVYVDKKGKINIGAMRKKLMVKTGERIVGMHSVSIDSPEIQDICRRIIDIFGLRGFNEIEMKLESGKFYATDVNPRNGGSIYLSKASGSNIAILPILELLKKPFPQFYYNSGVHLFRREIEKNGYLFFWDYIGLNNAEKGIEPEFVIWG